MSKLSYSEALKLLIEKHGLFYPIIRTKFGIVDGRKRFIALLGTQPRITDKASKFLDVEVDTIEEHLELIKALGQIRLKGKELKNYVLAEAKSLKKYNVKLGRITTILSGLTGLSIQHIRRLLPEEYKDKSQSRKLGNKCSPSSSKRNELISKIRATYDWLSTEEIGNYLKSKDPLYLLNLAKRHYEGLKAKPTIKAEVPELISVLYAKLEAANFPELDEDAMRWWKYLAEEYNKRYSGSSEENV